MLSAAVMPDPTRVRHTHARDVASEVIGRAERRDRDQALFIFPDGMVRILDAEGVTARVSIDKAPASLVGVYSADAKAQDIVDDIFEMERLH